MTRDEARKTRDWTGDASGWTLTGTMLTGVSSAFFGGGMFVEGHADYVPYVFGGSLTAFVACLLGTLVLYRKFDHASKYL